MRQTSVVKFLLVLCLVSITSAGKQFWHITQREDWIQPYRYFVIFTVARHKTGRVKEQLKDTMDKYQKVQVTLPQTPSAKGLSFSSLLTTTTTTTRTRRIRLCCRHCLFLTIRSVFDRSGLMQNIQNAIVNRQVSLRIPPIPFVSTIMRGRNGTRTNPTSASDNKTAAPSTTASQNNGVNTSSTVPPIKAGGLHSGKFWLSTKKEEMEKWRKNDKTKKRKERLRSEPPFLISISFFLFLSFSYSLFSLFSLLLFGIPLFLSCYSFLHLTTCW